MITAHTRAELESTLAHWRSEQHRWAFVPTMGALHQGHLSLVQAALKDFDRVVVSVFVNPTQFDRADDLEKYPRQPEQDAAMLATAGAHLLYLPAVEDVYPDGTEQDRACDLGELATRFEGASRPGHFEGVVQVVRRLVQAVDPSAMYMGQKDAQQVAVLQHVAAQEFWPVRIVACPIIREASGLAMSSRNGQLSSAGFAKAALINQCLEQAEQHYKDGQLPSAIEAYAKTRLTQGGLRPEYFSFIDQRTFAPLPDVPLGEIPVHFRPLIVTVAWLEGVRLIDNRLLDLPLRAEIENSPHAAANL